MAGEGEGRLRRCGIDGRNLSLPAATEEEADGGAGVGEVDPPGRASPGGSLPPMLIRLAAGGCDPVSAEVD